MPKCYFRCQVCHQPFSLSFKSGEEPQNKRYNKPTGKAQCCNKNAIYERKGIDYRDVRFQKLVNAVMEATNDHT